MRNFLLMSAMVVACLSTYAFAESEVVCTNSVGYFVTPNSINKRIKELEEKGYRVLTSPPAVAIDSNRNQILCVTLSYDKLR